MNKIIIILISIILALTVLSLPVLCEMSSGQSDGNSGGSSDTGSSDSGKSGMGSTGSSDAGSADKASKAREMYDSGSSMRESEGMSGMGFVNRDDSNYGNYVTFSVDKTTGDVLNYGISGAAVFDSIKIPGFDFKTTTTKGAETKIVSKDGSIAIQIHDNPASVMEIDANKKSTLILNLAAGVSASKQDGIVKIKSGKINGYLVSEKADSIDIAGSQITIDTNGNTVFRSSPVNMPHDDMEERFMGEVKTRRAGAEVSVGKSDKYSIVNYSDMNVSMDSIETNHIRMIVDSSEHAGKFILMNIDNSSLKWNEGDRISLHLDNKTMNEVEKEQDLYNATESSFWLNKTGPNRMQALMYVQNFSTHQVDIVVEAAVNQTPAPTGTTVKTPVMTTATATPKTPGFGLVLGTLGTLAAAYISRRKP